MLRRYLVPGLLLLLLIFVCGKLLLTPVTGTAKEYSPKEYERGWPWVFLRTHEWPPPTPTEVLFWNQWLIAADVAVLTTLAVASATLLEWRRRRRGGLRFSLRELLTATALVGIGLGWLKYRATGYEREHEVYSGGWHNVEQDYCGPEWLRRLWPGDVDIFFRAVTLEMDPDWTEDEARAIFAGLPRMPYVRRLTYCTIDTSADFGQKARPLISRFTVPDPAVMANIEEIGWGCFRGTGGEQHVIADDGTLEVLAQLPALRGLELTSPTITNRGIGFICKCKSLRSLALWDTQIDDDGVALLAGLSELRVLDLHSNDKITDSAIESILRLRGLEELDLDVCPRITDRGFGRLIEHPSLKTLCIRTTGEQCSPETHELLKRRFIMY